MKLTTEITHPLKAREVYGNRITAPDIDHQEPSLLSGNYGILLYLICTIITIIVDYDYCACICQMNGVICIVLKEI